MRLESGLARLRAAPPAAACVAGSGSESRRATTGDLELEVEGAAVDVEKENASPSRAVTAEASGAET